MRISDWSSDVCSSDLKALDVATGLGGYFEGVFTALTPEQVQEVLACEYGGINESIAELYARTNDRRWLAMAELFYDKRVLDPLAAREDKLANFHANTQVPKLIGLENGRASGRDRGGQYG